MSFKIKHKLRNKIRIEKTNQVSIGRNLKMNGCDISIKGQNNLLTIGDNVNLRDVQIEILGVNCKIDISDGVMIGRNSYLSAKEENILLSIGKNCNLSRNIKIMTSDGHKISKNGKRINLAKNIYIGENVWIADSVTILKGVTIQSGSVIGINSTVVKDVESNCVAVGNPCKVVTQTISWEL